eukprot:91599_1
MTSCAKSKISFSTLNRSTLRFFGRFYHSPTYPRSPIHDRLEQAYANARLLAVQRLWHPRVTRQDILSGARTAYVEIPERMRARQLDSLGDLVGPEILSFVEERHTHPGIPPNAIPPNSISDFLVHSELVTHWTEDDEFTENLARINPEHPKLRERTNTSEKGACVDLKLRVDVRFEHGQNPDVMKEMYGGTIASVGSLNLNPLDVERVYVWTFETVCCRLQLSSYKGLTRDQDIMFRPWYLWYKKSESLPINWTVVAMNEVCKRASF